MSSNQQHEVSCIIVKFYFTCIAVKNRENLCFFINKTVSIFGSFVQTIVRSNRADGKNGGRKGVSRFFRSSRLSSKMFNVVGTRNCE